MSSSSEGQGVVGSRGGGQEGGRIRMWWGSRGRGLHLDLHR